ncbi:U-box domain-containing protein 36-like isoform X2 [Actinidia eriantha]|uniref:U-box domain-containing protein 36-like isoform X2 n=1 Tax=Actinidia eriantha TaxID=165200 RepID=UPI002588D73D|nr:U-box domain-containing protein 36-like isoform X2 [Actinidia eriantha]
MSIDLLPSYPLSVKASIITTEAAQVQKGIVDLVNKHGIKKLVMGAETENCMKVRKVSSSKASSVAKMRLGSVRCGLRIKGNTFG